MSTDLTFEQERADREARMKVRVGDLMRTCTAIKADGRKAGIMDCQVCGAALHFSVASNGHQRARCASGNCINFIQ